MTFHRVSVLLRKELLELRRNPGIFLPMLATGLTIAIPFVVGILLPRLLGDALSEDEDFVRAARLAARVLPELRSLGPEAIAQAFLFHQFLLLFLLIPAVGAMAFAAYSIVGEKQNRTLESLLATPITTTELLVGKVLGAAVPAVALGSFMLVLYLGGVDWLAEPGVAETLLTGRTAFIGGVLGPLIALVALQLAVMVSSRVNDPRSAQQIGVVVVLPVVAVMVGQFAGAFWLDARALAAAGIGLGALWLALLALSVRIFERESILTRWK